MTASVVPDGFDYAPFYCEENAHRLVARADLGDGARSVVFVTNELRTVPIMAQRAAPGGGPVVWDYHVFVLVEPRGDDDTKANVAQTNVAQTKVRPKIWDLDCTIGMPLDAVDWIAQSFPWPDLPPEFEPLFRVVPADAFRRDFSSDRGHMLDENGVLRAPLPPWERPGRGPSNLSSYLDVASRPLDSDDHSLGRVLTFDAFFERVASPINSAVESSEREQDADGTIQPVEGQG